MSPQFDSFARAFALVGALGALLDGNRPRTLVAQRERPPGFSGRPWTAPKRAGPSPHALAIAAHVRDDRLSLAARVSHRDAVRSTR